MALIDKYRNLLNRADTAIDKKASQLRNAYSQRIAPRQSLSKPMFQYSNATNTPQYKMLDALTRYQSGVRNKIQSAERATTPLANRVGNVIEPFEKIATRRLLGPVIEAPAIAMMNDQQRANYKPVSFGGESLAKDVTGVWKGAANTAGLAYGGGTGAGLKTTAVLSAFSGKNAVKDLPNNLVRGGIYSAVSNPIIDKVSAKAAGRVGANLMRYPIKAGVMGTGNVVEDISTSGLGIDAKLTPQRVGTSFALGAGFGLLGAKNAPSIAKNSAVGRLPSKVHPEDVGVLDQAMDVLQNKKVKLDSIANTEYGKQINLLADKYLKKNEIDKIVAKTKGKDMRKYYVELGKAIQKKSREVEPDYGFADKMFGKLGIVDDDPLLQEARKYKSAEEFIKARQEGNFYHGTPSGKFGNAEVHVGTQQAAKEALEARIGIPADGKGWDGTKIYGDTLLAGKKTLRKLDPKGYNVTGFNVNVPENDFYLKDHPELAKATFGDGTKIPLDVKPNLFPVKIKGEMTNYVSTPMSDTKANATIKAMLKRGNAKRGYYYTNIGEDYGSISAVVPSKNHLEIQQTKQQLTDIWNKAQQITPPQGSMGFVGNNPMQMGIVGNSKNQDFENFLKSNEDMTKTLGGVPAPTSKYAQYEQNPPRNQQNIDETIIKNEFETNEIPKVKYALNQVLNPLKNTPKEVQEIMQKWRGKTLLAKEMANKEVDRFAHIPEEDGFKLLKYIQNPTPDNAKLLGLNVGKYANDIAAFRQVYDQMRAEGMKRGIPTNYVENYLNQVWKQSPKEISKAVSLSGNPAFTKMKTIPDYQTGMALGLTPKFTHPAQLVAHYRNQLERAVANNDLVNELKGSGYLLPSKDAPIDWKTIEDTPLASGLAGFKASPEIAKSLNNLFSTDTNMLLSGAAKVSRGLQDMTMTGGAGPVNSFTLGNAIKDITAGRVRSPVGAFVRSWSGDATKKFFKENRKYTQMMAGDGIALHTNTDYSNVYKNLVTSKSLGEKFGRGWNLVFNEATFKRFMPMLQLNMYKDTYEGAIKQGLSQAQARQLASQTTKSFYGVIDNFTRSNDAENAVSSLIFAPKFRESMINFWVNNIKSLDVRKPEYKYNRRFLVGTVITAVLMDRLNLQLNGRHMYENKDSKELSLEIPVGEGRSWFIPILPSISTLPRRAVEIGGALAGGDIALATERAGTFASTPLQLGADVLTNKTFYGAPIYDEDEDSALTKVKKTAGYAIEQSAPGFIGEPVARIQGRKTTPEMILGALEMPVYPSKSTDVAELSAKEIKKYNELTKTNPRQAEVFRQQKSAGKSKGNNLVPDVQAKGSSTLPAGDDLAILYKGLLSDIDGARNKRVNIQYDYTLTDEEKELKMEELRNDIYEKSKLWKQIKKEKPYEVFKIELDKYSNADVEERAAWAMSQIEDFVARGKRDAIPRLLETMWQAGVLTSGKKGSAQYIADNFGIDVSTRTKSASGAKKAKKVPTIKLTKAPDFAPNVKAREVEDIELSVPTFTAPQSLSGNSLGSFTPRANLEKIRRGSLTR